MRSLVVLKAGVIVGLCCWFAMARTQAAEGDVTRLTFVSGGEKIPVERFDPREPGRGKRPAIVFLHGADGMNDRAREYRSACRMIADKGYIVFLVHYFERTRTRRADKDAIDKHFLTWVGTVHDGLSFAARQPLIDPARIGMVGYSLGAYLSLSSQALAMRAEPRPRVIVEFFGGLPKVLSLTASGLPPTLILHGEKDKIVPVKEAYDLEKVLKQRKIPVEMKIYPDEGHAFTPPVAREAMELGFKFLEKHLKRTAEQSMSE